MRFRGWKLAPWGSESKRRKAVRGRIENASRGGISVLSGESLPIPSLIHCEIVSSSGAAAIPTLMQVRWNQKFGGVHRIGLKFIL
jgi:hypothetical protein